MDSDSEMRSNDTRFIASGVGHLCTFLCAKCDKPSLPLGSGIRIVMGCRQKVCSKCREYIDSRKAKASK